MSLVQKNYFQTLYLAAVLIFFRACAPMQMSSHRRFQLIDNYTIRRHCPHHVRGIIAPRTLTTYCAVWHALTSFLHSVRLSPSLPLSVDLLLRYIAHMYSTGFALSTICSHCSAIGFVHHINSLPNLSNHPNVLRFIKRLTSTNPPDIRMPIKIGLLGKLLHCLRHT